MKKPIEQHTDPTVCRNCTNYRTGEKQVSLSVYRARLCTICYEQSIILNKDTDAEVVIYTPQPHQQPFHASNAPNLLALGTRGTGKSKQLRWDAITRCLMFPGFRALIIRRKIGDLRKSHLHHIGAEMKQLGGGTDQVGVYLQTTMEAKFNNGSLIQFSHCEQMKDVLNYLSSEWDYIGFDELSTFTLEMFLQISAAARAGTDKPYIALVRCCSNPLGPGAQWMKQWFIDHDVNLGEYPDYLPEDFEMQFSTLDQNQYVNRRDYEKRLRNLPDHIRRAWLLGQFVIEGAYFVDYRPITDDGGPWHEIMVLPSWQGKLLQDLEWVSIYRAIDWGYFPDPWVCLWIAVLPNRRAFVFKERHGRRQLAPDVAKEIKRESKGMRVIESFCDPTMFVKDGAAMFSIAEQFEINGVPLTAAQNSRELYGYAIHEYLNIEIGDGEAMYPQVQILKPACPNLTRTIPLMQMDELDPRKIADGDDHWVVALAYFCMGRANPTQEPASSTHKRWMRRKVKTKTQYA